MSSCFLEHFQPIIVVIMCIVVRNVLEHGAFNLEFQYSIPLCNKIS
jgi:hypothetical protein